MSYVNLRRPSLSLFPSASVQHFSHIHLDHLEAITEIEPHHIEARRDLFTQLDVDDKYLQDTEKRPISQRIRAKLRCTRSKLYRSLVYVFPIVAVLKNYELKNFALSDLVSGVSAACLHFPQGLAYGILCSLTPAQGLYTSFFPVLFYMIFGATQHMSIGTNAVIALIAADMLDMQTKGAIITTNTTVVDANGTTTHTPNAFTEAEFMAYKVSIVACSTFIVGCILTLMGILRLGFLTTYQSTSFIGGFTTAAAFHIFTSQIAKALGVNIPPASGKGKIIVIYTEIFQVIGQTNVASLVTALITMLVIIIVKDCINDRFKDKMKIPIPIDLIVVVLGALIPKFSKVHETFNIQIVGEFEDGMPPPTLPSFSHFGSILPLSLEMALLVYFLNIAMANLCADKHEYEVDDNQEAIAYGLTNICSAFFQCFPASNAPPRTMILSNMGARTTLNGIPTCLVILLVILVLGQFFTALPVPVLAAMIIVAVKPLLFQVKDLPNIFRVNVYDFVIWVVACLSGIFLDLPFGLYLGFAAAFFIVVFQNQMSGTTLVEMAKFDHMFLPKSSYKDLMKLRSLRIFRMESSMYFATAEKFKRDLYKKAVNPLLLPGEHTQQRPNVSFYIARDADLEMNSYDHEDEIEERIHLQMNTNKPHKPPADEVKVIILDFRYATYIDIQGINVLSVIFEEYRRVNITVFVANLSEQVWQTLCKSSFFEVVSQERFFFELEDALEASKTLLY